MFGFLVINYGSFAGASGSGPPPSGGNMLLLNGDNFLLLDGGNLLLL